MSKTIKIIIPTAGLATRMRPQTWSKPKPLVSVAGRTVLDHMLGMFRSVPVLSPEKSKVPAARMTGGQPCAPEFVIILSPGLGESQIPPYMQEHHPGLTTHYVVQPEMRGQSDALWLAHKYLSGPVVICFADTLMETDFSFLADEKVESVAWVKSVPDPRRFGVAELDTNGWVTHLVEKPKKSDNLLVVVGCYYFRQAGKLLSALETQFKLEAARNGEFFLTDAINIMIERGLKMRTQRVIEWLDTGTIQATLETNRYFLEHGISIKTKKEGKNGLSVVPPAFIHASARVSNSVIGPYASIGENCSITNSRIEDSIIDAGASVENAALRGSFIGRQASVRGRSCVEPPMILNIGDDSSVSMI
jgi:glucose-1-phosphate thymidylyltransferase